MGCINSRKKLTELKTDTALRVRVVQVQPDTTNGFLELTRERISFISHGGGGEPPVVWALQHLRRYGVNGDLFSFEAGRRCMTGPGIYTFRCSQAESLYLRFQRNVNAVSEENFTYPDREHPSHTFGRPENPHTNNYLEPAAPMIAAVRGGGAAAVALHESFSSSPLSLEELDSPDSVPSLSFTNEVVHFQSQQQQPSTPGAYANNVYLEHPLRARSEHNNNYNAISSVGGGGGGSGSAFSTLRKAVAKRSSLDIPPEECAPMLARERDAELHMYANVDGLGSRSARDVVVDPAERCYENLSRLDMTLILKGPPLPVQTEAAATREPTTPGAVNYIVLDLDQPRSPVQSSPKAWKASFGSELSLTGGGSRSEGAYVYAAEVQSLPTASVTGTPTISKPEETNSNGRPVQSKTAQESSLGYSTIDFIKTCALIKSSTHGADFDAEHDQLDQEESRRTRHSKCVRKAYSISE